MADDGLSSGFDRNTQFNVNAMMPSFRKSKPDPLFRRINGSGSADKELMIACLFLRSGRRLLATDRSYPRGENGEGFRLFTQQE